jgi:transcriptional regulator with XRE-family HTH domain
MTKADTWLAQELRKRRMSQRQLAQAIGCSPSHAHRLVTGQEKPSPKLCREIARVFEVTEQEVMRRVGHLSPLPDGYSELDEQRLAELYRALGQSERNQLMRFAEFLQKSG